MWLRLSVVLVCVLVSVQGEEEELVRCKRPLCEEVCPFGTKTDHRGCPTCQCVTDVIDPCESKFCAAGFVCEADLGSAKCVRTPYCPVPMCDLPACQFGLLANENGCETCSCKPEPCATTMCDIGMTCENRKCTEEQNCEFEPKCVGAEEAKPECSGVSCFMFCERGFKRDENGCEICACQEPDTCDEMSCPDHEVCRVEMPCTDLSCKAQAACASKPLCEQMRAGPASRVHRLYWGDRRPPTCKAESGEFEYKQCDEEEACWCVDDRGVEVPETRRIARHFNDECVRNRTHAVDVRFNMTHNHPNLHQHLVSLQEVTVQKVTEWLLLKKDYVTGLEVEEKTVDIVEVHFLVVRGVDEEVDLPSAVFHFHYVLIELHPDFQYQGSKFAPEPASVSTQHHYEPQLPAEGGLRHRVSCWFPRGMRVTPARVILLITSACIVIIVSIGLCCACRRMKKGTRQKYDTQKANLAFTNDLYNSMHKLGGEEKYKLHVEFETAAQGEENVEKEKGQEKLADVSLA